MPASQAPDRSQSPLVQRAAALLEELVQLGSDPRPEVRERVRRLQDELRLTRLLIEVSQPLRLAEE